MTTAWTAGQLVEHFGHRLYETGPVPVVTVAAGNPATGAQTATLTDRVSTLNG